MVSLSEGGPHHWDSVSLHVLCQSHLNRASPALNWGYGGHRSSMEVPWNPRKSREAREGPDWPRRARGSSWDVRSTRAPRKPWEIRGNHEGHRGSWEAPGTSEEASETPGIPREALGTSGRPREALGSPWDVRAARGGPGEVPGSPGRPTRRQGDPGKPLGRRDSPGRPGEAPGTSWETQEDPREALRTLASGMTQEGPGKHLGRPEGPGDPREAPGSLWYHGDSHGFPFTLFP